MKKSTTVIVAILVLGGAFLLMNQDEQTSIKDMYAYVHTIDGDTISIPHSQLDKGKYLAEKATHIRKIPTSSATIEIGSEAVISKWEWVDVMNESAIIQRFSNGSSKLVAGDTCGIEFGGYITVKKIRGDKLLAEYTAPGNPVGTPCPSGIQFIVSKSNFATMNDRYSRAINIIQSEKDLVERLLAQNYYGEKIDAGNWHWVHVMNNDPITQKFSNGYSYLVYGDKCGIGHLSDGGGSYVFKGGTIQVRGKENGKVLYEYTASGNPYGTPCPSGILFFDSLTKI